MNQGVCIDPFKNICRCRKGFCGLLCEKSECCVLCVVCCERFILEIIEGHLTQLHSSL